jgi:hypothetical protein
VETVTRVLKLLPKFAHLENTSRDTGSLVPPR